jgi:hypothetical protein
MREDELRSWLEAFGRAWETQDANRFAALFSEDASYWEKPFDDPMVGTDAIRGYSRLAAQDQQDGSLGFEMLSVSPVVVRWWASYVKVANNEQTRLGGFFCSGSATTVAVHRYAGGGTRTQAQLSKPSLRGALANSGLWERCAVPRKEMSMTADGTRRGPSSVCQGQRIS